MKIGVLGPAGTFSEEAAKKHFPKDTIHIFRTNAEIFDAVQQKKVHRGLIPIENMLGGTVGETLDNLYNGKLQIAAEMLVPVHLCIAAKSATSSIKKIISHPMALAQCREYLLASYPDAKIRERSSTAFAMSEVAESDNTSIAAVGPKLAAQRYGLTVLAENIQENEKNVTRFIVVAPRDLAAPSKRSKTSIAIHPHEDRPGLLLGILQVLAGEKINMTKIESRPSGKHLGDYIFYIDFEGHRKQPHVARALKRLAKEFRELKVFGSYDSSSMPK